MRIEIIILNTAMRDLYNIVFAQVLIFTKLREMIYSLIMPPSSSAVIKYALNGQKLNGQIESSDINSELLL